MIVMLPIPDAEGDITLIGFSVTEGHIFCYFLLEKRNKCYVTLKKNLNRFTNSFIPLTTFLRI